MTDVERAFHETWLGMAQPSEGLVVSVAVLVENQCMAKQPREAQELLRASLHTVSGQAVIADLSDLLGSLLKLSADLFDTDEALPKPLRLYVPEGKQEL